MKPKVLLLFVLAFTFCNIGIFAKQIAFPGAAGFGKYAVGGRYGSVYHVTNLNDSGTGSLRDAVSQSKRIVVFDVSGIINITSRIVFSNNLYVAGQTAPGEGIIVYGDGVSFSGASNTIVRYMRFRMGKNGTSGKDCAGASNGTNMIFDHCSFSWGLDETFSLNPDGKGDFYNITISNSIIGQGLLTHSAGGLIQTDSVTLYRNFYCDNSTRNNKIKGINQYVNNVVYNWKNGCYLMGGDSEGSSYVNTTNNLFINGPAGGGNAIASGNSDFHIYAEDNWQDRNTDGTLNPYEIPQSEYSGGPTFASSPYPYPELPAYSATELIDKLIPNVGANLPYRDLADFCMVHEVKTFGTDGALLSNEGQLPVGAPSTWEVKTFTPPTDTDGDGMPDDWENANGTNPSTNDAMTIASNGYANIENYVNSISVDNRTQYLRKPVLLSLKASTDATLTLKWYDFTEGEEGFSLEQNIDGEFKEIAKINPETETYTVTGLTPATAYTFRLRAYKAGNYSDYSDELSAKTQPLHVDMVDCDSYVPDYTWKITDGAWDKATANWTGGTGVYADESKVLFAPAASSAVTIAEDIAPAVVVVKGDNDVAFSGAGDIGGTCSLNKTGDGALTLGTTNSYSGATVMHGGVTNFSTLKEGGVKSSLGASYEFAQNWIWDGGVWNYTGASTSTNRSAKIYSDTELNISNNATVSMSGGIEGSGDFTLNGSGKLSPSSPAFFKYDGNTVLKGGTLYLGYLNDLSDKMVYLGDGSNVSTKLVLAGGTFQTTDKNDNYCTYTFPIEVMAGTTSTLSLYRNCYIKSALTGYGTLAYTVSYVREYIQGNWDGFYGNIIANGTNSDSNGSQLMLDNTNGIPNASIYITGNTRVVRWGTNGEYHLGGLSGDAGTYLGSSSKKTKGSKMTWDVGGANTDETFNGIIDNRCCTKGYDGVTSIVKEGSGLWRLTGKNSYTGTTTVKAGRLVVNGTNSGTGMVLVSSGGTLAGKGTIAGLAYSQGGTISAGDTLINSSILKLTGGCTLNGGTIEIPLYAKNNEYLSNQIKVTGAFTITDGVLSLNMDSVATAIPDGTSFQVFNTISGATISGTGFTTIYPETPSATQKWDTSELLTTGKIYVRNTSTGINSISADTDSTAPKYDLNGRKVQGVQSGIYIQNGKKYIHK